MKDTSRFPVTLGSIATLIDTVQESTHFPKQERMICCFLQTTAIAITQTADNNQKKSRQQRNIFKPLLDNNGMARSFN